jgi:hypothetical protein
MLSVRWCLGLALGAAWPLGCSSDDDAPPPPAAAGTRSGGPGGGAAAASASGGGAGADVGGAAAAGDAGDGNIGHIDAGGSLSIAGAPTYEEPRCDVNATWANPTQLEGISTPGADERLLSMTHDELTLVFTRDDLLMVTDREAANVPFGVPQALTLPAGYTHERGLALHPDGLALVVGSDSGTFADIERSVRSGPFDGAPSSARYDELAANAALYGETLASPVLSASGTSLYFTQIGLSTSRVFHAQGTSHFPVPALPEDLVTLGGSEGDFKLTLSVSSDERTLFYFDEALGHAAGLWSSAPLAPFTKLAAFAGLQSIFTNFSCGRLYGTRMVEGSLDVVLEAPP